MPTYDYKCKKCGHIKEIFHSITREPEIECNKCGEIMEKLVSGGTGFIINGGGTRRRTFRHRYAKNKKTENLPTPSESAQAKAEKILKGDKNKYDSNNPYKDFKKH